MSRHDPQEARTLGLWTAAWLGGLLLAGLLWVGDLSLQWPVLLVPVLWAVVAARPRRDRRRGVVEPPDDLGYRTDTVERPALRPPDRRDGWS
jgi:multidrug efflux pump subunit AcrA (membrane-fusion protein)